MRPRPGLAGDFPAPGTTPDIPPLVFFHLAVTVASREILSSPMRPSELRTRPREVSAVQRDPWKSLLVTSAVLLFQLLLPALGHAQSYSRLQVLLPGETEAPGTGSGKFGTPTAQTVGTPFTVRVRACDAAWNTVTSITDVVQLSSTDATATLPAPRSLQSGVATFTVTITAIGSFTISARDQTDNTIPQATSAPFSAMLVQGFEFARINQKNQYAGVAMNVSFTAVDPQGDVVTGFSGQVNLQQLTSFGVGRIEPSVVTLSNGSWSGNVTMYRADETAINRGNVNIYAFLPGSPGVNGTSDPFTVHPGSFSRVQIVVPGQDPAPGSSSGVTGDPATQGAVQGFAVEVYATDTYWNPVPSSDTVRLTSSDAAASTPVTGALSNGFRQFTLSLGTVGTQTLTVTDQTNGSIQGMTCAPIQVIPSAVHHFVIDPVSGPLTAGVPVTVRVRATDAGGNTIPAYNGDAFLSANTGPQSLVPRDIVFSNGVWSGQATFFGAGGAVSFTCADFGAPPRTGTSSSFEVRPGPFAGLQVVPAGQVAQGGTPTGVSGVPSSQQAGSSFSVQVRAVDAYWNRVSGINDRIGLASSDAFASMPAETLLANGELLLPVTLFEAGMQTITASDVDRTGIASHTSSPIQVLAGNYARIVVLTSGQSLAPGTPTGQFPELGPGQDINLPFTLRVYATDSWFNAVGGAADRIRISSTDPFAVAVVNDVENPLPLDIQLADGYGELRVRASTGGFQQMIATNLTQPTMPPSSTQFEVDEYGFYMEAVVGADMQPDTFQAGEQFILTVTVRNEQGAIREDFNTTVDVRAVHASTGEPGRGALAVTRFMVTQGRGQVAQTYTFAEPIQIEVVDLDGNGTTTELVTILPGPPAELALGSDPSWVGGNKHATLSARVLDAFGNGVPGRLVRFQLQSGPGTLSRADSLQDRGTQASDSTDAMGVARADFHAGREPAVTRIRATSGSFVTDLDLQTAFVDPNATGGYVSNYPNPFHPNEAPTTIAYKLADNANVKLEIYTLSGGLVLRKQFSMGDAGGAVGLNEFVWDGKNGKGDFVSSGGYVLVIEAEGVGETLHVMRRKIAVVR